MSCQIAFVTLIPSSTVSAGKRDSQIEQTPIGKPSRSKYQTTVTVSDCRRRHTREPSVARGAADQHSPSRAEEDGAAPGRRCRRPQRSRGSSDARVLSVFAPAGDEPVVLASLSTANMDQVALLRRIVDAVGVLPVRGVVTTGHAIDPEELPSHPQVQVL